MKKQGRKRHILNNYCEVLNCVEKIYDDTIRLCDFLELDELVRSKRFDDLRLTLFNFSLELKAKSVPLLDKAEEIWSDLYQDE